MLINCIINMFTPTKIGDLKRELNLICWLTIEILIHEPEQLDTGTHILLYVVLEDISYWKRNEYKHLTTHNLYK